MRSKKKALAHARTMRRVPTPAEDKLWQQLRAKRLGGHKFRRQVPIGPYVVDILCASARLIIELNGVQHDDAQDYDENRTLNLEAAGFQVLRYKNGNVLADLPEVLDDIIWQINNAKNLPN